MARCGACNLHGAARQDDEFKACWVNSPNHKSVNQVSTHFPSLALHRMWTLINKQKKIWLKLTTSKILAHSLNKNTFSNNEKNLRQSHSVDHVASNS